MDALELLVGRESAMKLASPGPDQEALEKMFQSAIRAPDHGRLRPWRFVVVPEERRERFGELMADCLRRQQPDAPADMLQRERDKAMRAPVIVVAAAAIQRGHKIAESNNLPPPRPRPRTSCWRRTRWGSARCGRPARRPTMRP